MTRPTRVDHGAVARALAVANAKTGLFAKGKFMHDTPERTLADPAGHWLSRVIRLRSMLAEERAEFEKAWGFAPPGSLGVVSDDVPAALDTLGRAVIEAARVWVHAPVNDLPGCYQAMQALMVAVRTYDAARNREQRENDDAV